MGLFEAIGAIQKMADDPRLADAAKSLGEAALAFPKQMQTVIDWLAEISRQQTSIHGTLVEISLGLDTLADPIKRPRFTPDDIEAAMSGTWPRAEPTQAELEKAARDAQDNWAKPVDVGVLFDLKSGSLPDGR